MRVEEVAAVDVERLQSEPADAHVALAEPGHGPSIARGESVRVTVVGAIGIAIHRNGCVEAYFLGLERSHDRHRHLAVGDVLIAVTDSDPTGTTKVILPACGCRALLIRR